MASQLWRLLTLEVEVEIQRPVITLILSSALSITALASEQTLNAGDRVNIDVPSSSLTVRLSYPNLNGMIECLDSVLGENGTPVVNPVSLASAIRIDEGYFLETEPQEIVFPTISSSNILSYQLLEQDVYVTRIRISSRDGRPLNEVVREISGESYGSEYVGFERTERCGTKP